jgi:hypothetical protein
LRIDLLNWHLFGHPAPHRIRGNGRLESQGHCNI